MAIGGANISRGMGRGAAQVYDTSAPINMYAKLMQQQQLRREAEQKSLNDKLNKFDSKGVRVQDREGFNKVYEDWQKASIEALKATDRNEKFRLNAEAQNKLNAAEQFVYDSKAKTQRDLSVGTKILGKPYFFSEEGKKIFEKSLSAPIYSKDDIVDYSTIPLGYDKSKVIKDLNEVHESLLKTANYDALQGVEKKVGDLTYVEFPKIKTVLPENQIKSYELLYRVNDGFQAVLEETYPNLDWDNNKEEALQIAIPDFASKNPLVKDEGFERRTIPNREMTAYQKARLALEKDKDGISISDIKVGPKTFTGTKLGLVDKNTGKPIMDASGKKQLTTGKGVSADFPIYSTVNPTAFKIPQNSSVYDIKRGVNKPITEGISAALTGIGYAKVKGGKTQLRATLTTDGEDQLMVRLSDLPPDVRNDKFYKITLDAVEDEYKRLQQLRNQTKTTAQPAAATVRIQLPTGEIGEVPKDKADAFMKKYPKAKILQ